MYQEPLFPKNYKPADSAASEDANPFSGAAVPANTRVECARDTHHPMMIYLDTPNLDYVAAALRDCGRPVSPELLACLLDSLRTDTRLFSRELRQLGAAELNAEFIESREALSGKDAPTLLRERVIEFGAQGDDDHVESWQDRGVPDLMSNTKLILRLKEPADETGFLLYLQFDENGDFTESRERRWQTVSNFADYFSESGLPDTLTGFVSAGQNPACPSVELDSMQFELQNFSEIEKKAAADDGSPGPGKPASRKESPPGWDDPDTTYGGNSLEAAVLEKMTGIQLTEIFRVSGLESATRDACDHIIEAVKFGTPLDHRRLTFLAQEIPLSVEQTYRIVFSAEGENDESVYLDLHNEGRDFLGALEFNFYATKLSSEGLALSTQTEISWARAKELSRAQCRELQKLITRRVE